MFDKGPYSSIKMVLPSEEASTVDIDKDFINEDEGQIIKPGFSNNVIINDMIDSKDLRIKIKTNENGDIEKSYDKVQKNKGIREFESDIPVPENGIIVAGENELFDNVFIECPIRKLYTGSFSMNQTDEALILSDGSNELMKIENCTIRQITPNFGNISDETIGNKVFKRCSFLVYPSNNYGATKVAGITLMYEKEKVNETFTSNGIYEIMPLNGDKYFDGATINVNVPQLNIGEFITRQVTADFGNITDDNNFKRFSFSVNKDNGYDGMERAFVTVLSTKEHINRTITGNGTYEIPALEGNKYFDGATINVDVSGVSNENIENYTNRQVTANFNGDDGDFKTYSFEVVPSEPYTATHGALVTVKSLKENINETYTENGTYSISALAGNKYFNGATINVNVPQSKIENYITRQVTANFGNISDDIDNNFKRFSFTVEKDSNYDAMQSANITVLCEKQNVTRNIVKNGVYTIDPLDGNKYFNGASITVRLPLQQKSYTVNNLSGDITCDSGYEGLAVVHYSVNTNSFLGSFNKTITSNSNSIVLNLTNGSLSNPYGSNVVGMKQIELSVNVQPKTYDHSYTNSVGSNDIVTINCSSSYDGMKKVTLTNNTYNIINYVNFDSSGNDYITLEGLTKPNNNGYAQISVSVGQTMVALCNKQDDSNLYRLRLVSVKQSYGGPVNIGDYNFVIYKIIDKNVNYVSLSDEKDNRLMLLDKISSTKADEFVTPWIDISKKMKFKYTYS